MKKRNPHRFRRLALEPLESRLALAGDVLLTLAASGELTIRGDDADNNIALVQTAAGSFTITGNDGETFRLNGNNFNSGDTVNGVTKDIKIDLKKGKDAVRIEGLGIGAADPEAAVNLLIATRQGADTVVVKDLKLSGNLTINTGAGDANSDHDFVEIDKIAVAKNVSIKTGKGNDFALIKDSEITGKTMISTNNGDDEVALISSTFAAKTEIQAGAASGGVDVVNLGAITALGELKINQGAGEAILFFENVTAAKASIKTGAGQDSIFVAVLNDLPVAVDQLVVDLGSAIDQVFIGSGGANAKLVLNGPKISTIKGGSGSDKIEGAAKVEGAAFLKNPLSTGVEAVID